MVWRTILFSIPFIITAHLESVMVMADTHLRQPFPWTIYHDQKMSFLVNYLSVQHPPSSAYHFTLTYLEYHFLCCPPLTHFGKILLELFIIHCGSCIWNNLMWSAKLPTLLFAPDSRSFMNKLKSTFPKINPGEIPLPYIARTLLLYAPCNLTRF